MDKIAIKNFAVRARNNLIDDISKKAYGLDIGKDKIEEIAYTWFNRFIVLRFMEVNNYLPSGVIVLSSTEEGKVEPDIITEVLDLDLEIDRDLVHRLIDENDTEGLYSYLLVKQCNELGRIMPHVFEETSDYTELLLPDNLLGEGSVIRDLVDSVDEEDYIDQVEIIGWMYQYYISEKKDEVFADLKKNIKISKENIPVATQLFTPKWIVQYMIENSLGRLWLESHPDEELQVKWKYYLEAAETEGEVQAETDTEVEVIEEEAEQGPELKEHQAKLKATNLRLEEIKVLDPACGSGHILVYAFDLLYEIYLKANYLERDIPRLILEKNLYGLDIDDRAGQLASFALMMKARGKDRHIFGRQIELNICSIQESNGISKEAIDYFVNYKDTSIDDKDIIINNKDSDIYDKDIDKRETAIDKESLREDVEYLVNVFHDAKEYGSIIDVEKVDFDAIDKRIEEIREDISNDFLGAQYKALILEKIPFLLKQGRIMSDRYDVVCTNPPYMGKKSINPKLNKFLSDYYPLSKQDLYGTFIDKCLKLTRRRGISSLITMQSWMFLSSYKGLRDKVTNNNSIINMVHLGAGAFEELNAFNVLTTTFCIRKGKTYNNQPLFIRLVDYYKSEDKPKEFFNKENHYTFKQSLFTQIPGTPLVYWISKEARAALTDSVYIKDVSRPKQGLATGNNNKFIRLWHEVSFDKIGQGFKSTEDFHKSGKKYAPYNKGGDYRKWYGNFDNVIMFDLDNYNILSNMGNHLPSRKYYFKKGITWSLFGFENFGVRYKDYGCVFDVSGSSMFPEDKDLYYILGFLASKVAFKYLSVLAPTVNFQVGNIADLPLKINEEKRPIITKKVKECIEISKEDWDRTERSWDFEKNELIDHKTNNSLEDTIESYCRYWETRFQRFLACERNINQDFIEIYNLQKELSPEIETRDISILKDTFIIRDDYSIEANKIEIIKAFISYAVGCMFGRYSLDEDGLIYAGGEFDIKFYKTFIPTSDNIIVIADDDYFEDDIVSRFVEFVRVVFEEENIEESLEEKIREDESLEMNLDFIVSVK